MRKYLDLTTWIILFALLPFTVLVFLSQGSGPGDLFYPVKRGMENIILAGASFSPSTKVAFRTDLTERRFKEAEKLLLFQGQTTALTDFIGEVQITQEELFKLSSFEDKKELSDKLIAKIDEYEVKLAQVQTRVEQAPAAAEPAQQIPPQVTPSPQPVIPGETPSPVPSPQTTVTPSPAQVSPSGTPAPPAIQIPIFQPQSTPQTVVSLPPSEKEKVKERIEQAKEKLKEIKKEVKKDKEDAEVKEKIKEEQEKLRENLKENRREDGKGSGRNGND